MAGEARESEVKPICHSERSEESHREEASESEVKLKIADIVLAVRGKNHCLHFKDNDPHGDFIVPTGAPDLMLLVDFRQIPHDLIALEDKIFNSGGVWSLYRSNGLYLISLFSPVLGKDPYRIVTIDEDFNSGVIYCGAMAREKRNLSHILEYPLDEVIFLNLLSRGRGLEVHACGLVLEQQGLLFLGRSGAGKSTFANLWQEEDASILSDDRIIIRKKDGLLRIYGTPWHGDAGACSTESAPLQGVFFLAQAPENRLKRITSIEAAGRLFQCCFPTFYDRSGMGFATKVISQLTQQKPCYEFGFVPDRSAVEFVQQTASTGAGMKG